VRACLGCSDPGQAPCLVLRAVGCSTRLAANACCSPVLLQVRKTMVDIRGNLEELTNFPSEGYSFFVSTRGPVAPMPLPTDLTPHFHLPYSWAQLHELAVDGYGSQAVSRLQQMDVSSRVRMLLSGVNVLVGGAEVLLHMV